MADELGNLAALHEMRSILIDLLTHDPTSASHVGRVLKLLERVEQDLQNQQPRFRREGTDLEDYRVESLGDAGGAEMLTERREGSRPLRSPAAVYTATVATLAAAKTSLAFDAIKEAVRQRIPEVGDHQIRVALRFLQVQPTPLVERNLARYSAGERAKITTEAKKAWAKARRRP